MLTSSQGLFAEKAIAILAMIVPIALGCSGQFSGYNCQSLRVAVGNPDE